MGTLLIAVGALVGYLIAYHTYGRWLSRKIFKLDKDALVPSIELNDDVDYVPTKKAIVFGHHFTSIAGTGPIVGPAIAVMWGWLPALLWVFLGSILIGAVHDFGALVVSLRNRGQTVGDIAGRMLNKRVRIMFLLILFMALTIVLAIFGLVIAAVFKQYPAAIFPCTVQIPIAIVIGIYLHRKGVNILIPSIIALMLMYTTVIFGDVNFFTIGDSKELGLGALNAWMASWPTIVWVIVLLVYSYFASVLPVWTLLQPRDFINSLQLLTALGLILIGLVVAAFLGGAPAVEGAARQPLEIVAPMVRWSPEGAPMLIPFLFITIACGAISGFHCLVSSGTSSKQLKCETDAQFVGYGSMLTEGFLATLVILACVAGLGLGIPLDGKVINNNKTLVADYVESNGTKTKLYLFADELHPNLQDSSDNFGVTDVGASNERNHENYDNSVVVLPGSLEAQLIGAAAYNTRYRSWSEAGGLGAKVGAFVDGSANFLKALGIPAGIAVAMMGVLVASFAGTTLDTACRLQRYVIQELASTFVRRSPSTKEPSPPTPLPRGEGSQNPLTWLTNKHGATIFAITIAALVAALPKPGAEWTLQTAGTGGLILWPLFGATNQLLGGLAFLVIAFYLWRRRLPVWFIIFPMLFMLVMPAFAMIIQIPKWISADSPNWTVIIIAIATMALEAWMIIEAIMLWPKARGEIEQALPPLAIRPVAGVGSTNQGGRSC
ncbi:MAG: carbon starvation protein A [Planctomycetes bacterium]|nr:carbon starvation protein A [Planctomycetota bacterium]